MAIKKCYVYVKQLPPGTFEEVLNLLNRRYRFVGTDAFYRLNRIFMDGNIYALGFSILDDGRVDVGWAGSRYESFYEEVGYDRVTVNL